MAFCQLSAGRRMLLAFACIALLPPTGASLEMPKRTEPEKYAGLSAYSSSRLAISGEEHPSVNPLDSSTVYDKYGTLVQTLALDVYQGPYRKYGFSSNLDFLNKSSVSNSFNVRNYDTAGNNNVLRAQTLNFSVRDVGIVNDAVAGRQNVFTGFHFYKMDGICAGLALWNKARVYGFFGTRVDTNTSFGGPENKTGFVQFQQDFGFRSGIKVSFERALLANSLTANDAGINLNLWLPGRIALSAKGLVSFGETTQLSETRIKLDYYLSAANLPYAGFDQHTSVFADSMSLYFYDVFNYKKFFAGWRFKPFAKKHLYFTGEYNLLLVPYHAINNLKLALSSTFLDGFAALRVGEVTTAGLVSISGKYPFNRKFTLGCGADYANMDVYYGHPGPSDFYGLYCFTEYKPFAAPLPLLRVMIQDRSDIFSNNNIRLSADLNIGFQKNFMPARQDSVSRKGAQ